MPTARKISRIVGFVLHLLIGGLLLFAGAAKLADKMPPEVIEKLATEGLADWIKIIGIGEIVTAILMILPWTMTIGLLLESALWGGIILHGMRQSEPFAPFAIIMIVSWVAAALRYPPILGPALMPRAIVAPSAPGERL